jgi:biopolymer transport protein ExbD
MKVRRRLINNEEEGDINVSPLIDVVFILLIFFIVSATFVTLPGIDVSRPKVQSTSSLKKNSILFALSDKNKIFHAGNQVDLKEISPIISQVNKDGNKPVIIQVDKWADATLLAKMISEAKKFAPKVSLATLKNK